MHRRSSDYEERVLHFIQTAEGAFSIRQVAECTGLSHPAAAAIVSKFELVGLVKMVAVHPEQHYKYKPSTAAMSLPAVKRLFKHAEVIQSARKVRLARDLDYVRRRG